MGGAAGAAQFDRSGCGARAGRGGAAAPCRSGQLAFGAGVGVELDEELEPLEDDPLVDGAGALLFSAGLAEDDSDADESFLPLFSADNELDLLPESARESLR